jgi:hypothetical protein
MNRPDRTTKRFGNLTYEDLVEMGYVLVWSPGSVARTVLEQQKTLRLRP